MSDPYARKDPTGYGTGTPQPDAPLRTDLPPVNTGRASGSGLGTGLMVGGVFVVVAILAFAFYSPGDDVAPVVTEPENAIQSDGTAVPVTPEATPDTNTTLDAPAATDGAIADPATADTEAATPDTGAAEPATGGTTAPAAPAQP